jgi:hypothetical protein
MRFVTLYARKTSTTLTVRSERLKFKAHFEESRGANFLFVSTHRQFVREGNVEVEGRSRSIKVVLREQLFERRQPRCWRHNPATGQRPEYLLAHHPLAEGHCCCGLERSECANIIHAVPLLRETIDHWADAMAQVALMAKYAIYKYLAETCALAVVEQCRRPIKVQFAQAQMPAFVLQNAGVHSFRQKVGAREHCLGAGFARIHLGHAAHAQHKLIRGLERR